MNYNKLTTKPFLNKNIKQNITDKILIKALKDCYLKTEIFYINPIIFLI